MIMSLKMLTRILNYNYRALKINTDDISHEESLVRPDSGGNCINWVLGHILTSRNGILKMLGEPNMPDIEHYSQYARGSETVIDSSNAVPIEQLLENLQESQKRLENALNNLSAEDMEKPTEKSTVGETLEFLQFHETYHIGQLGILRRVAGKDGAIK
jgi:uncharacterized damage-inducible protein DinB